MGVTGTGKNRLSEIKVLCWGNPTGTQWGPGTSEKWRLEKGGGRTAGEVWGRPWAVLFVSHWVQFHFGLHSKHVLINGALRG